jgi:hypothetical protein
MLLGLPLFLAGCGSRSTVSGTVKYKGQIVKTGSITFVPADGGKGGAQGDIKDGTYTVKGLKPGPMKIAIYTPAGARVPETTEPGRTPQIPKEAAAFMKGGLPKDEEQVAVPPEYNDPEKSGLTFTVKPGKQTHDIDISPSAP